MKLLNRFCLVIYIASLCTSIWLNHADSAYSGIFFWIFIGFIVAIALAHLVMSTVNQTKEYRDFLYSSRNLACAFIIAPLILYVTFNPSDMFGGLNILMGATIMFLLEIFVFIGAIRAFRSLSKAR